MDPAAILPNKVRCPHRPLMGQDHLACLPAVRVQSTPNCSRNGCLLVSKAVMMLIRSRGVERHLACRS